MKPHPLTLEYLRTVALRPGMYMGDYDLRALELQLYGFEEGLDAAGVFGDFDRFNKAFWNYVIHNTVIKAPRGWAYAILDKYGQSRNAFDEFLSLVARATADEDSKHQD